MKKKTRQFLEGQFLYLDVVSYIFFYIIKNFIFKNHHDCEFAFQMK